MHDTFIVEAQGIGDQFWEGAAMNTESSATAFVDCNLCLNRDSRFKFSRFLVELIISLVSVGANAGRLIRSRVPVTPTTHRTGVYPTLVMTLLITMGLTSSIHGAVMSYRSIDTQSLMGGFDTIGGSLFDVTNVDLFDHILGVRFTFMVLEPVAPYRLLMSLYEPVPQTPPTAAVFGILVVDPATEGISYEALHFDPVSIVDESAGTFYPAAVPIPAAAWLFFSALIGLVVIKRKRKRD